MSDATTDRVRAVLADTYKPEGVEIWLDSRHVQFGGKTALQMIAAGKGEKVLALAEQLRGMIAT